MKRIRPEMFSCSYLLESYRLAFCEGEDEKLQQPNLSVQPSQAEHPDPKRSPLILSLCKLFPSFSFLSPLFSSVVLSSVLF